MNNYEAPVQSTGPFQNERPPVRGQLSSECVGASKTNKQRYHPSERKENGRHGRDVTTSDGWHPETSSLWQVLKYDQPSLNKHFEKLYTS